MESQGGMTHILRLQATCRSILNRQSRNLIFFLFQNRAVDVGKIPELHRSCLPQGLVSQGVSTLG